MSDTPRTDAVEDWSSKFPGCKVVLNWKSQALERELNAANERIKRLEEAGNRIARWCGYEEAIEEWNAAKESKP